MKREYGVPLYGAVGGMSGMTMALPYGVPIKPAEMPKPGDSLEPGKQPNGELQGLNSSSTGLMKNSPDQTSRDSRLPPINTGYLDLRTKLTQIDGLYIRLNYGYIPDSPHRSADPKAVNSSPPCRARCSQRQYHVNKMEGSARHYRQLFAFTETVPASVCSKYCLTSGTREFGFEAVSVQGAGIGQKACLEVKRSGGCGGDAEVRLLEEGLVRDGKVDKGGVKGMGKGNRGAGEGDRGSQGVGSMRNPEVPLELGKQQNADDIDLRGVILGKIRENCQCFGKGVVL